MFENRLVRLRCTVFECKYNDNENSFCNHKKPSIHIGSDDYFTCFEQPIESKKHINYPVRGKLRTKN